MKRRAHVERDWQSCVERDRWQSQLNGARQKSHKGALAQVQQDKLHQQELVYHLAGARAAGEQEGGADHQEDFSEFQEVEYQRQLHTPSWPRESDADRNSANSDKEHNSGDEPNFNKCTNRVGF